MVRTLIQLCFKVESQHQTRHIVHAVSDEIDVPIIVVVAEGAAARGRGLGNAGAGFLRNIGETAVVHIVVEQLALRVARFGAQLLHLRIDMAVADEDVGPAIIVEIEKTNASAEKLRVAAESSGEGGAAEIVVERRRVASEICFYEIEVAVEIAIAGGNAHASLGLAIRAERAAGVDGNVLELSIFQPGQRKNIFEEENQSRAAERLTHQKRKKQNQAASWKFAEAGQRMRSME
jgi:hypothetical protein